MFSDRLLPGAGGDVSRAASVGYRHGVPRRAAGEGQGPDEDLPRGNRRSGSHSGRSGASTSTQGEDVQCVGAPVTGGVLTCLVNTDSHRWCVKMCIHYSLSQGDVLTCLVNADSHRRWINNSSQNRLSQEVCKHV